MGQVRDAQIADWQRRHGISPPHDAQRLRLDRISTLAAQLIQVVALEQVGIRDGDGFWSGCDPVESIVYQLRELVEADRTPVDVAEC